MGIHQGNIEDIYPLSPMQQGMLFHTLYGSGGPPLLQWTSRFDGRLNVPAWQQAWQRVIERHSILRTAIALEDVEEPVQIAMRAAPLPWAESDLAELTPQERAKAVDSYIQRDRSEPFELSRAPLMRLRLLRLGDQGHLFLWTFHLLLLDGWSMALVVNEVLALYEAFGRGEELRLESSRPFRDFIAWYQGQNRDLAEPFWRKTLKGILAPTPLGIDRTPTAGEDPVGDYAEEEIRLSREATGALQAFCRQHRLTLSTLLRASWALLLSRYSGEASVVFGATMSGRPATLPGIESMVGLFINTLPVRVDVPEHENVLTWLTRFQEQQAELLEYEFSSLVDVQGCSEVPRGLPLFESVLVVQTYPVDEAVKRRRERLGLRDVHAFERTNIPLTLQVRPGEELSVNVSFDRDRFENGSILRMLSHFRNLLESVVVDPTQEVLALSPLSEDERRRILFEWNATDVDYPQKHESLSRLFEEQAARTPGATALVFEDQALSYRELDVRANQLAHLLRSMGVGPEVRVGVCMERSFEMVVALLSVLKAGGAYVPLDPADPNARRAFVLQDASVSLVLTQERFFETLAAVSVPKIVVDKEGERLSREDSSSLPNEVTPENLAYVIYTSGSTGKPKGTMIPHRGIVNRLLWMQEQYGLATTDRVLQKTPFGFDVSVWEFFWPLLNGSTLVLARPGDHQDAALLARLISRQKITVIHFVPSMLRAFLEERDLTGCGSLRLVICSGEELSWTLQEAFYSRMKGRLENLYGPTEASIDVTFWSCERTSQRRTVPIGRAIANTQIFVLDRNRRPVPIGVPGELYIGGVGLARGYLGRPDLTAERFLPNPFGKEGTRLYRTGDLVRYLRGGEIEFLGRLDDQVKVRGHRIELGEIESAIAQHPGVRAAAVAAREDAPADRRLVAYLVCEPGAEPTDSEMRALLRRSVPEYMVPSAFVRLERLPLTPSGKVNRQSLPAPDKTRRGIETTFAAPRTPIEEMLVGIWKQVLDLDCVGIHDNFFDLGGHSVLATQVFSRIREQLQVALPLHHLFEQPNIQALAALVEAARAEGAAAMPPPLHSVSRDRELPLSFAQQRLWFIDQLEPGGSSYNALRALRLKGRLDHDALRRALAEIVARHESLRTTFQNREGQPVQVVSEAGAFELSVRDLSGLGSEREREGLRLVEEEVKRPFDLPRGPLFRASLFRLGLEEHIFVVVIHHIVCDGWSMGVFFRELEALYGAFSRGESSPLPAVRLQYADYAVWERDWFQGEVLEKQLAYWTEQLRGAPPILDLRGDRPRPEARSFRGARQRFALPKGAAERIAALSRSEGVTVYMTLLAAFAALLWRQTGQEEIVVGSPIFGRDRVETEGLIGFFINTIVLRIDMRGNPSFRELLLRVRETALGAYAHQDVPLERLVDALKLERSLSHNPLFQVWFVLQNAGGPPPKLEGLSVEEIPLETEAIRHDLQLSMSDAPAGLAGEFDYATDIFDASTVARLGESFERLLLRLLAQPGISLDALRGALDGDVLRHQRERLDELERESLQKLKKVRRKVLRG